MALAYVYASIELGRLAQAARREPLACRDLLLILAHLRAVRTGCELLGSSLVTKEFRIIISWNARHSTLTVMQILTLDKLTRVLGVKVRIPCISASID